jgi:phosphoribosylpyrophosphate synthetase/non-canonical (house-cleaning) NTP pyrophosphatase
MNLYPTNFSYIHVKWDHFNDGTQDIFFPYAEKLRDHDVVFLMSNYDQSKLIDQWMLERVLPRQKVNSLQIWLPYFSTATHERVTKPGVVAAAEPMWKLLSSGMPKTKTGPAELINVDIHAQQEQFYGTDDLTYTFLDGVPRFLQLIDLENTTIIFPDNGSCKRFKTAIDKYKIPTLVFEKQRLGDERKVSFSASYHFPTDLKEKEKCMRYGIIVDDLALSGSTLIETAKALKEEMKFEFISCYITHACFPLKAYNKFKKRFDPFTTVYCTDSIPDTQEQILKLTNSPFYILPLAPLFSNYINKEDNQRPKLRIASTNKSKISAVSEAFNFVFQFGYYSVSEDNSSSNVNPQPIGDETLIGAKYRIYNLSANIYKAIEINRYDRDFDINDYRYKYFFSIENGLFQEEGKWYDKAVIIIEDTENKTEWIGYSDPTPIPTKYVEASRATNFMKTAGEFIHEEFPEYDAGDWFLKFGPKSRKQVLKETIIKGLYQLLCS